MVPTCNTCKDTGVVNTGNKDVPCCCSAGDTAIFYRSGIEGAVTGAEVRRHFQNDSPEPIEPTSKNIPATALPERKRVAAIRDRLAPVLAETGSDFPTFMEQATTRQLMAAGRRTGFAYPVLADVKKWVEDFGRKVELPTA